MIQHVCRMIENFLRPSFRKQAYESFERFSNMDDGMTDGELEVLLYVREEAHYIHVLDSLNFQCLIVQKHFLSPDTVQSVLVLQGTLTYCWVGEHFGCP